MDRLTQSRLMHYLRSKRPDADWPEATPDVVYAVYRQGRTPRDAAVQLGVSQGLVDDVCEKLKELDRVDPEWYRVLAREEAEFSRVLDETARDFGEREFQEMMERVAVAWLDGVHEPRKLALRAGVPLLVALDMASFLEWASLRGQTDQDDDGDGGQGVLAPLHPLPFRPRGPWHGIPFGDRRERPVHGTTRVGQA